MVDGPRVSVRMDIGIEVETVESCSLNETPQVRKADAAVVDFDRREKELRNCIRVADSVLKIESDNIIATEDTQLELVASELEVVAVWSIVTAISQNKLCPLSSPCSFED